MVTVSHEDGVPRPLAVTNICKLLLYNKVDNIVKHEKYCDLW